MFTNLDRTNIYVILLMVLIPMVFVGFLIPVIKKVAFHINALDIPNARKIHTKPMPRLGGLGIFAGFLLGYMLFGNHTYLMNSVLIASFVLLIVGMIDDIKPIRPRYKLIGQLIASLIVVVYGGLLLQDVSVFGLYINFGWFSYVVTVFFILGCINCMNLIDGLDGLAGGISTIFFLTISIIGVVNGEFALATTLTLIILGSTLGFLFHNFHPAKIFMGDSGSMFLGLMIAVITLMGFKSTMMSAIVIPLFILMVPILDTTLAILRRKLKGESVDTPDKSHIHHQLMKRNLSQRTTVLIIYFITSLFSAASVIYALVDKLMGYMIYGFLMIIAILFVMKTDILFEHKKK